MVGLLFLVLRPNGLCRGVARDAGFFLFLALRLQTLGNVFDVYGEHRAHRRIFRHEVGGPHKSRRSVSQRVCRVEHQTVLNRQNGGGLLQRFLAQVTQGAVVVQNVETASKRRNRQIVFPTLYVDVPNGDRGQSTAQSLPRLSAVHRTVDAKFRAHKQQVGVHMVLR